MVYKERESCPLRLGLPSVFFPSSFPTKILYWILVSPMRATWPVQPILLDLITNQLLKLYKNATTET
jgi:hypothetical protein